MAVIVVKSNFYAMTLHSLVKAPPTMRAAVPHHLCLWRSNPSWVSIGAELVQPGVMQRAHSPAISSKSTCVLCGNRRRIAGWCGGSSLTVGAGRNPGMVLRLVAWPMISRVLNYLADLLQGITRW
jgi:hypothetical protein